jgi:lysophospholipase L1-like esterase
MKHKLNFVKAIFCIQMLFFVVNISAQNPPFWNDVQAFKKQDSLAMPTNYKTLFIGSSSFTKWKTLEQDLPEYAPLNRAFGGATLLDVIRYQNDVVDTYNPERIVIYCGENDVASSDAITGKIVLDRFKLLYQPIRERFPAIDIYFISLKPSVLRWRMKDRMIAANNQIEAFCKSQKNSHFISIWNQMLVDSKPNPALFIEDKLHMNKLGYEIWMKEIRKRIKE